MKFYFVISPLKDSSYSALLSWGLEVCKKFSLVWRDSLPFNQYAKDIESKLASFLILEEHTSEWPGTKIYGPPENIIRFYKVSPESIEILKTERNIYAWESPDCPEDLAFYKADGSPWFGSVAHEQMSFFMDPQLSEEEIKTNIADIALEVRDVEV